MTIQQIHDRFLHFYDKQSNFSAPEITAEEIDIYLNRAQSDFIDDIIARGSEKNNEYSDRLKNLIIPYSTNTFVAGTKPNGYKVNIPLDYRSAQSEEVSITYADCNGTTVSKRIPVVPITRDEYNDFIKDPFNLPWFEEVKRLAQSNNQFEIICSSTLTPTTYYLDYLKIANSMQNGAQYSTPLVDIQCELDETAQHIIVDKAVLIALKNICDPRIQLDNIEYQSQLNKIK